MKPKSVAITLLFGYTGHFIYGNNSQNRNNEIPTHQKKEYHTLDSFFAKANWNAHTRYFYMHTLNEGVLTDYFAHAAGAGIAFSSANIYGFSVEISGFFIHNLWSQNLSLTDTLTSAKNRYEIGLFDIENPNNKNDLDRLEHFHLLYNKKSFKICLGKQTLNTPLINLQDGRMRPTLVKAIDLLYHKNLWNIQAGWVTGVSPRSTVKWYKIGESIGVYNTGKNHLGISWPYKDHISSKGISYIGISKKTPNNTQFSTWNHWVENVMNTFMFEIQLPLYFDSAENKRITLNGMGLIQNKVQNGGNANDTFSYFPFNDPAKVISLQCKVEFNAYSHGNINVTRMLDNAPFIWPREWGKEPFYTFISRERNEGLSNTSAISVSYHYYKNAIWSWACYAGYYLLPHTNEFAKNKYGLPSYMHFNLESDIKPFKKYPNISFKLLLMHKKSLENNITFQDKINKTDLWHWNMVFNHYF